MTQFNLTDDAPQTFNNEMLSLARGSMALTQEELADKLKVSQGKVAKWESGLLIPTKSDIADMAAALNYTVDFFHQSDAVEGFGSCCMYHRKRQSLPVRTLSMIHDRINVLSMGISRLLRSVSPLSRNEMLNLDIDEYGSPEMAANALRAAWKMPHGHVRNLVHSIESAGGIVVQCLFGTNKLDAVSLWPRGMPPLFFINRETPADRCRFTLCHELGHIVMHRVPPPEKDAESQADRFASEFLMPSKDISAVLDNMSLDKALRLKPTWRVSMQALIEKAHTLGKITPRRRQTLYAELSRNGYRTNEPGRIDGEKPLGLLELVNTHRKRLSYSDDDLARVTFCTSGEHFRRRYGLESPEDIGPTGTAGNSTLRIMRDGA